MTLSLDTAYRSFGGEVEASSTPTICRIPDSRRHQLWAIALNEAARRSGQTRFTALLHHVDVAALERAFRRQRRAASPGIDRVKVEDYERNLEANLQRLHASVSRTSASCASLQNGSRSALSKMDAE